MSFRRLFVVFPFVLGAALAIAAESPSPRGGADATPTPKPSAAKPNATPGKQAATRVVTRGNASPSPAATPEKKRGFFSRVFGAKETPTPATPTPRPVIHHRKPVDDDDDKPATADKKDKDEAVSPATPENAPAGDNKPESTEKPEKPEAPAKTEKPEATEKPDTAANSTEKPAASTPAPATPAPKKGAKGKGAPTVRKEAAPTSDDPEEAERLKFSDVKNRADADKAVAVLREKSDNATSDEESRKAMRAYNKALFDKMRSLDPSLGARIDRMESAVLKQLDSKAGPQ